MFRNFIFIIFFLSLITLTGCISTNQQNHAEPQTALEGRWKDTNNIITQFHNGMMTTYAPDTQEKLAEGNYVFFDKNKFKIELRSIIQGTVSHVNCLLYSDNKNIFCKPQKGKNFSLKKIEE